MKAEQEMSQLSNRFATVGDTQELDLKRLCCWWWWWWRRWWWWLVVLRVKVVDILNSETSVGLHWPEIESHFRIIVEKPANDVPVIWFLHFFRYSYSRSFLAGFFYLHALRSLQVVHHYCRGFNDRRTWLDGLTRCRYALMSTCRRSDTSCKKRRYWNGRQGLWVPWRMVNWKKDVLVFSRNSVKQNQT